MSRTFSTLATAIPNDIASRENTLSTYSVFNKGLSPPPFTIKNDIVLGAVTVVFEKTALASCVCEIECQTRGTLTTLGPFCPEKQDYVAVFTEQTFLTDQPTTLDFLFTDALGNVSTFPVRSLAKTVPMAPLVAQGGYDVVYGIPLTSSAAIDLREHITHYQVQRYVQNPYNRHLLVDWTPINRIPGTHTDRRPPRNLTLGYRVRYRTTWDNTTPWSAWSTLGIGVVSVPDTTPEDGPTGDGVFGSMGYWHYDLIFTTF